MDEVALPTLALSRSGSFGRWRRTAILSAWLTQAPVSEMLFLYHILFSRVKQLYWTTIERAK